MPSAQQQNSTHRNGLAYIALLFISCAVLLTGTNTNAVSFLTPAWLIRGEMEVEGGISVVEANTAYGVHSYSEANTAIGGATSNGVAINGIAYATNGTGVTATNLSGGFALRINGRIYKPATEDNRLTIYDDSGNVLGSFLFSFD